MYALCMPCAATFLSHIVHSVTSLEPDCVCTPPTDQKIQAPTTVPQGDSLTVTAGV